MYNNHFTSSLQLQGSRPWRQSPQQDGIDQTAAITKLKKGSYTHNTDEHRVYAYINELEKEDEFSVDAPKEWGLTQLTKGDTITPDMWKNIDESL